MKKMKCKDLGGACDVELEGESFQEIAEKSRKHAMEMVQAGDEAHIKAMKAMEKLMEMPDELAVWMAEKRAAFEALPDIKN